MDGKYPDNQIPDDLFFGDTVRALDDPLYLIMADLNGDELPPLEEVQRVRQRLRRWQSMIDFTRGTTDPTELEHKRLHLMAAIALWYADVEFQNEARRNRFSCAWWCTPKTYTKGFSFRRRSKVRPG